MNVFIHSTEAKNESNYHITVLTVLT